MLILRDEGHMDDGETEREGQRQRQREEPPIIRIRNQVG